MSRTQPSWPLWDVLAIVLLLIAALKLHGTGAYHRYGYYESLRSIVSMAWIAAALRFRYYKWQPATIISGIVVLLFNPVLPVTMHKSEWQPYDFSTMLVSLAAAASIAYLANRARVAIKT